MHLILQKPEEAAARVAAFLATHPLGRSRPLFPEPLELRGDGHRDGVQKEAHSAAVAGLAARIASQPQEAGAGAVARDRRLAYARARPGGAALVVSRRRITNVITVEETVSKVWSLHSSDVLQF